MSRHLWFEQVEEGSIADLKRCLEAGLLHGNLAAEAPAKLTLNNLLQFAQLAQMGLQWLVALSEPDLDKERHVQVSCGQHSALEHGVQRTTDSIAGLQDLERQVRKQAQANRAAQEELSNIRGHEKAMRQQLTAALAEVKRLTASQAGLGEQTSSIPQQPASPTVVQPEEPQPTQPQRVSGFSSRGRCSAL